MSIAGLPEDLDLVVDMVYVKSVGQWPGFYVECGGCGGHTAIADEMDLHEVIDWARGHVPGVGAL